MIEPVIEWLEPNAEGSDRMLRQLYEVLYRDFGVAESDDWYHGGEPSAHVVAVMYGALLGSARLMGEAGDERRQIRQVAVDPAIHGTGVGRLLVAAVERRAADEGASEVWLNARDTAYGFYERLGYRPEGEVFVSELTGIPHRLFVKRLG